MKTRIIEFLAVFRIVAVTTALFLPAMRTARGPARSMECKNNLKNIVLALHTHVPPRNSFTELKNVFDAAIKYPGDTDRQSKGRCVGAGFHGDDRLTRDANSIGQRLLRHTFSLTAKFPNTVCQAWF